MTHKLYPWFTFSVSLPFRADAISAAPLSFSLVPDRRRRLISSLVICGYVYVRDCESHVYVCDRVCAKYHTTGILQPTKPYLLCDWINVYI
jgi:hypothetical protein